MNRGSYLHAVCDERHSVKKLAGEHVVWIGPLAFNPLASMMFASPCVDMITAKSCVRPSPMAPTLLQLPASAVTDSAHKAAATVKPSFNERICPSKV
jgi:hypothetical protein